MSSVREDKARFDARCTEVAALLEAMPRWVDSTAGKDFARGAKETVEGMRETSQRLALGATPKMWRALDNIERGVSRWRDNA